MNLVLIQLFWLSLVIIGAATLLRFAKLRQLLPVDKHWLITALLSFAIGVSWFIPLTVAGYIWHWPIPIIVWQYLLLLLAAVYTLLADRNWLKFGRFRIARQDLAIVLGVTAVLLFDYVLSLKLGGTLFGDAPVHMARINLISHGRLTLTDPYFGANGVVDPRYSTNLLDALMAVAVNVLRIPTNLVWRYSFGFYRLMIWLGLFAVSWVYLPANKKRWSYLILALVPLLYSYMFLNAAFPDRAAFIWMGLFFAGVKFWLETKRPWLLLMSAVLLAVTHPLNALMAAGFLVMLAVILALFKALTKSHAIILAACLVILLPPVILNLHYPNRIALSQKAFDAGAISGSTPVVQHLGPLVVAKFQLTTSLVSVLVLLLLVLGTIAIKTLRYRVDRRWLAIFGGLLITCWLLAYSPLFVALVGYGYLIWRSPHLHTKIVIALAGLFYGLLIYNPIFWAVVYPQTPLWVVARFQEFNLLALLVPIIGWLVLLEKTVENWGYKGLAAKSNLLVPVILLLVLPQVAHTGGFTTYRRDWRDQQRVNRQYSGWLHAITANQSLLQGQTVYSNDESIQTLIPAVALAKVVNIDQANFSPMANIPMRFNCATELTTHLELSDLQAAGVTRVIADPDYGYGFVALADSKPYLSLIGQANGLRFYAVETSAIDAGQPSACRFAYGQ